VLWRDGWFEFTPCESHFPIWLRQMTLEDKDDLLLEKLRDHQEPAWLSVEHLHSKSIGDHEGPWAAFIRGEFPGYPEKILRHDHEIMDQRLEFIASDRQSASEYSDSYLQRRNPVAVEGVFQLSTGGVLPVYNGGLVQTTLRYFDGDRQRPGLCEGVAALVESISSDSVQVRLVNTSHEKPRHLIIQAGFYGEHEFTSWEAKSNTDHSIGAGTLHASVFRVSLEAKADIQLFMGIKRYTRPPSMELPSWK